MNVSNVILQIIFVHKYLGTYFACMVILEMVKKTSLSVKFREVAVEVTVILND